MPEDNGLSRWLLPQPHTPKAIIGEKTRRRPNNKIHFFQRGAENVLSRSNSKHFSIVNKLRRRHWPFCANFWSYKLQLCAKNAKQLQLVGSLDGRHIHPWFYEADELLRGGWRDTPTRLPRETSKRTGVDKELILINSAVLRRSW